MSCACAHEAVRRIKHDDFSWVGRVYLNGCWVGVLDLVRVETSRMSTVAASAATAIYGLSTYIDNERDVDHAGGLLPHDIALTVAMEIYGGVQSRGEQTLEAMACLLSEPARLRPCQELKTENLGLALALPHEYSDCRWRPIFCVEVARHKQSGLMYLYRLSSVWSQGCRLMKSEMYKHSCKACFMVSAKTVLVSGHKYVKQMESVR